MSEKQKGFTLVELVVVLAIIGIISLIVLTSTDFSHKEARDQRRQADLKEIQIDLAQYYEYYSYYPSTIAAMSSFIEGGAGTIPTDPLTGQSYFYAPYMSGGINSSYCIGAELETTVPVDNATAACTAEGITSSSVNYMQQPPQ